MFIVTSFSQLKEALRYEVSEILLTGQIAIIVYESMQLKRVLNEQLEQAGYTKILLVLLHNFDILDFRSTENNSCLLLGRTLQNMDGKKDHA